MITKSERTSAAAAAVVVITGHHNNNSVQGAWEGGREGGRWKLICKGGAVAKFLPATTNLIWQQGF
jgi:hypothetical protein